jgi:NAD+ synthetase
MKEITDYNKVFETLVTKTAEYLTQNNLKAMILGISGGIDSTVVAAICSEVSKHTDIPLIGRSLPTKFNKDEEVNTAKLVGQAFCNDFEEVSIKNPYESFLSLLNRTECGMTAIANGNIQARLRMIYLYHLASTKRGLVMDTDNLTENNLGYFTIHGDVGDFNPIGCLWKTEVFELAAWLVSDYYKQYTFNDLEKDSKVFAKTQAIMESLKLKPTAGLGITDSDLDEIGAESYEQVDFILKKWLSLEKRNDTYESIWDVCKAFLNDPQMSDIHIKVIMAVTDRHLKSVFKRQQLPIKIKRNEL